MAELMEQRVRVVERQQSRLSRSRLRKIADIENDRPHIDRSAVSKGGNRFCVRPRSYFLNWGAIRAADRFPLSLIAPELLLVAQRGHPGAAVLGAAREIVADEQADVTASLVRHLEGAGVGVIQRHVNRLEAQAEQPARGLEGGLDHLVELEIWLVFRALPI